MRLYPAELGLTYDEFAQGYDLTLELGALASATETSPNWPVHEITVAAREENPHLYARYEHEVAAAFERYAADSYISQPI